MSSADLSTQFRSPLRRLNGVQIIGTGSYVPENVITNDALASLGCDAGGSGSPLMPTTATASLAYFSDSFWMCGIDLMHGPQ